MRPTLALALSLLVLSACRKEEEPIDVDLDGFAVEVDCNDDDAAVNPDAEEVCDGIDNNCDEDIDVDAVDAATWYADGDSDGWGTSVSETSCDAPDGYTAETGDCNDSASEIYPGATEDDCSDPVDYNCDGSVGYADADNDGFPACEDCDDSVGSINPNAIEICDGLDNNCDTLIDEDGAVGASDWYADTDDDGFGDPATSQTTCDQPEGYVADLTDCNDSIASVYPGADETCNDVDDDCDGELDENATDASTWYADSDGDGSGGLQFAVEACAQPEGHVSSSDDCDDLDAATYPGATEVCDEVDNNCDGVLPDDESDLDSDGFVACADDCDDDDATAYPSAPELCDGVDNNCNGHLDDGAIDQTTWYADTDGDGYGHPILSRVDCEAPAGYVEDNSDCDDSDATINPGTREVPGNDKDDTCDGESLPLHLYSIARSSGAVWAVDAYTGDTAWTAAGHGGMIDVVVGPDGTIYASEVDGNVVSLDPEGNDIEVVATGYPSAHGLWYDYSTDTILLTTMAGVITEIDPATGATTDIATGLAGGPVHSIRIAGEDTIVTTFRDDHMLRSLDPTSGDWTDLTDTPSDPNIIVPALDGGLWIGGGSSQSLMYVARRGSARDMVDVGRSIYGICAAPMDFGGLLYGDHFRTLRWLDGWTANTSLLTNLLDEPWSCASNTLRDFDEDGYDSRAWGGPDCDDLDATINPDATDTFGDGLDDNCDFLDGTDADDDGFAVDDTNSDCADPDDSDASVISTTCALASCKEYYDEGRSVGDGVYTVDATGGDPSDAYDVYCDMSLQGGGWTLLSTHTNADGAVRWYHPRDSIYWTQENVLGTPTDPSINADSKSQAFNDLPIDEVMIVRYPSEVHVVSATNCIQGNPFLHVFQRNSEASANCAWSCGTVVRNSPWNQSLTNSTLKFRCRDGETTHTDPGGFLVSHDDNSMITTLNNSNYRDNNFGIGGGTSSSFADWDNSSSDAGNAGDNVQMMVFGR